MSEPTSTPDFTLEPPAKAAVGTLKLAQVVEAVNDVSRTQIA